MFNSSIHLNPTKVIRTMLRAGADTTVGGVQRDSSFQLKPFKFRFKTELDPLTLPFQLHSGDVGADASCSSERVRGLPGIYLFLHIDCTYLKRTSQAQVERIMRFVVNRN